MVALALPLLLLLAAGVAPVASGVDDRVFNAADYGAIDDDRTNNTAAFAACLADLVAAGGGQLLLPRAQLGIYRGSIAIPAVASENSWMTVEIVGGVEPTPVFGTVGNLSLCTNCSHVVLKSAEADGPAAITALKASSGSATGGWSMVFVSIRNLEIRTHDNPAIGGIDLLDAVQCSLANVLVTTGMYATQCAMPTHGTSGVVLPRAGNGAYTMLRNVVVTGYATGIIVGEHTDGDGVAVLSCLNGLSFPRVNDASRFGRVGLYNNAIHIEVTGGHGFSIQQLMIESPHGFPESSTDASSSVDPSGVGGCGCTPCVVCTGKPGVVGPILDLHDPKNLSYADITYSVVEGMVGAVHGFSMLGGANVNARRIGEKPRVEASRAESGELAARLRSLSALREEGLLPEELYLEAVRAELAAWAKKPNEGRRAT